MSDELIDDRFHPLSSLILAPLSTPGGEKRGQVLLVTTLPLPALGSQASLLTCLSLSFLKCTVRLN